MTLLQRFRKRALSQLPSQTGVYALCDLDETPIYIGQSVDGIRPRVLRHLTSARSDVIANRMVDVWEVAHVWAWPREDKSRINRLEAFLFHRFNRQRRLMNGSTPADPGRLGFAEPKRVSVQVLPTEDIASRKRPELRLPRQILQFSQLMDYILNVKDAPHLREALQAHFERVTDYYTAFSTHTTLTTAPEVKKPKARTGKS